jgi:hypothetical protein
MKRCTKCGEIKGIDEFYKKKNKLYRKGYVISSRCKICENESYKTEAKLWREKNKEKLKIYKKKYHEINKEKLIEISKKYHETNREKDLIYLKKYFEKHKNKWIGYWRKYAKENRKHNNELQKAYNKTHICKINNVRWNKNTCSKEIKPVIEMMVYVRKFKKEINCNE